MPEIHRRVLERLINDSHWREADVARNRQYYGTAGVRIAAIIRHWHDPFRHGLLRANDVSRLIDLLFSSDNTLARPITRGTLVGLLDQNASVLAQCGEAALARRVKEMVAALRLAVR